MAMKTIPSGQFDHCHILLTTTNRFPTISGANKLYRFEAKWIHDLDEEHIITGAWKDTVPNQPPWKSFQIKLNRCRWALTSWDANKRRETKKELEEKVELLWHLQYQKGPSVSALIQQQD